MSQRLLTQPDLMQSMTANFGPLTGKTTCGNVDQPLRFAARVRWRALRRRERRTRAKTPTAASIRKSWRSNISPARRMIGSSIRGSISTAPAAKMADHVSARRIFKHCAKEGVLAATPWMAWTEENGYDRPSDPAEAADWDRKAAGAGYSIGQSNHGFDLLRGHGVRRAARQGEADATDLATHGYDPEFSTPEAHKDRYRQRLYWWRPDEG
jgi:hypothetical protein